MIRLFVLLAFLGAGCSPTAPPSALVWARSADSTTLDPAESDWGEDIKIVRTIFEPLVSFKENSFEIEGRLAASWEISADGRTATFELRDGVAFHDGSPLDPAAVVFTFERLLDPAHPHRPRVLPHAPLFRDIEKVEALAPRQVRFTLRRPSAVFLQSLTHFAAGIVSPAAVRRHGKEFHRNPAGTGPFRLARWEREVKIELERFAGYRGPRPGVERLIVVPIASPQAAVERLRRGDVHVVDHPSLSDVKAIEADPSLRIVSRDAVNVCCLGFNLRRPPYDDLEFRRAVSLAIDRKAIVDLAYFGLAEPAAGVVPPSMATDPQPPYAHDPEEARRLAARLPTRQVELIHVSIARPYMPEPHRLAELLKSQLERAGFQVTVSAYDRSAYGRKTREEGHPMFILGWHADFPDPDNYFYPLLHGDNAGDLNGSFFSDPEFDAAVTAARSERDPAARRALYAKASARYRELLPTIPLVHVRQIVALSRRVEYPMHPMEPRLYAARFVGQ